MWIDELTKAAHQNSREGFKFVSSFANERRMQEAIAAAVLLAYLGSKAVELVARALRRRPDNRLLWALVATFFASFSLWAVTGGQLPSLLAVGATSAIFAVIAAKVIETQDDRMLQRYVTYDVLVDDVFHRPWFSLRPQLAY